MANRCSFEDSYIPEPNTGCWLWFKGASSLGYGNYWFRQRSEKAYRVSWIMHKGEIPSGMFVCHKCDTPACVNPEHLFLGTHRDNMQDAKNKKRFLNSNKTHCLRGHPLSGENLYVPPKRPNRKDCKTCRSLATARMNDKRKEALCHQL